jgi:predicted ATPase
MTSIFLHALARSRQLCGNIQEAFEAVDRSIAFSEETKEGFWRSEPYRLKGELFLSTNKAAAEECFANAIAIAKSQEAKLYELAASIGMARLWQGQGKTDEARDLLTPIHGWFTEGFETAYLKQARALLDELG